MYSVQTRTQTYLARETKFCDNISRDHNKSFTQGERGELIQPIKIEKDLQKTYPSNLF